MVEPQLINQIDRLYVNGVVIDAIVTLFV